MACAEEAKFFVGLLGLREDLGGLVDGRDLLFEHRPEAAEFFVRGGLERLDPAAHGGEFAVEGRTDHVARGLFAEVEEMEGCARRSLG